MNKKKIRRVTPIAAIVFPVLTFVFGFSVGFDDAKAKFEPSYETVQEATSYANAEETVPSEEPVKEEATPSEEPVKEEAPPSEESVKEEATPSEEVVQEEVTPSEEEQYYEDPVPEETEYYEEPVEEEPVQEEQTVYYEEPVEEEPVQEELIQEEDYWSMEFGDVGLLVLPDVGYKARLFDTTNMSTEEGQKILDKQNAAVIDYCPGKEISNSIYDHAGQGFDKMKNCRPGYSSARILKIDGKEEVFICTGIDYNGINDGYAIRNSEGYNVGLIDSNMMYMVTCNDSTGRSVTISYWYPIGYEKELIQGEPYTDPSEYILVSEENDEEELEYDEYFERNLEEGEADWEDGKSEMTIDNY